MLIIIYSKKKKKKEEEEKKYDHPAAVMRCICESKSSAVRPSVMKTVTRNFCCLARQRGFDSYADTVTEHTCCHSCEHSRWRSHRLLWTLQLMTPPLAQLLRELLTRLQTQTIADSVVIGSTVSSVAMGDADSVADTDVCSH